MTEQNTYLSEKTFLLVWFLFIYLLFEVDIILMSLLNVFKLININLIAGPNTIARANMGKREYKNWSTR